MTTIKLQIPPDLLAAVDRFIEEEVPAASRTDAMVAALRAWAVGNGLMLSWRGPQEPPASWPAAANDG
ncbi:ribbon-helix-helix domain-containing protein [Phreatobacter sp.]|uniref:ribbon-helix-helix domain-containing protein n=1 Tax=Phreatobacter sp. TaxID=1966341 RepID=UPI0022C23314|nr:ribbon-helix-helix domain-containing protein [Phreatobacter sp.]MCZ8313590.1 ribbon-helix-helix domain-containing protein [Phreatobacter sp.]